MSKLHFTTKHANAATVKQGWYIVDGTNQTVGRIASKIAAVLRGKNKAYYTPHVDCGDYVIIINAEKVLLTGNKFQDKQYLNYSGYPGGKKEEAAAPAPAEAPAAAAPAEAPKADAAAPAEAPKADAAAPAEAPKAEEKK